MHEEHQRNSFHIISAIWLVCLTRALLLLCYSNLPTPRGFSMSCQFIWQRNFCLAIDIFSMYIWLFLFINIYWETENVVCNMRCDAVLQFCRRYLLFTFAQGNKIKYTILFCYGIFHFSIVCSINVKNVDGMALGTEERFFAEIS